LVGSQLLEQQEEWQLERRRFFSEATMAMGLPRFGGHRSGIRGGECTGAGVLLLVIDRAEVVQR
jgi:hypothetical protein